MFSIYLNLYFKCIYEVYLWEENYDSFFFLFSTFKHHSIVFTCIVSDKCDVVDVILILISSLVMFQFSFVSRISSFSSAFGIMCVCVCVCFQFILLTVSELLDLVCYHKPRKIIGNYFFKYFSSHSAILILCRFYHLILAQSS